MRALVLVAVLAGANPGTPPGSGMTIAVTIPATVWNTPNQFAMTLLPNGEVSVVDSRIDSPGWTIVRQHSAAKLTLTVLG